MFVLGFIALAALILFLQIAIFTWATPDWTVQDVLTQPTSWLLYGIMFILFSLGAIGLDIWDDSRK